MGLDGQFVLVFITTYRFKVRNFDDFSLIFHMLLVIAQLSSECMAFNKQYTKIMSIVSAFL